MVFSPLSSLRNEKQLSGNFVYYRMERISDIYFVGGFGTVQWVDTNQFRTAKTDPIVTRTATSSPEATLLELNGSYGRTLPRLLDAVAGAQKRKLKAAAEEAMFVSIDRLARRPAHPPTRAAVSLDRRCRRGPLEAQA